MRSNTAVQLGMDANPSADHTVRPLSPAAEERRYASANMSDGHKDYFIEREGRRYAGMHLIAWLNDAKQNDAEVCESIWKQGVDCLPVSMYCDRKKLDPGIMLGFACAPESKICECVVTLYSAVKNLAQNRL